MLYFVQTQDFLILATVNAELPPKFVGLIKSMANFYIQKYLEEYVANIAFGYVLVGSNTMINCRDVM